MELSDLYRPRENAPDLVVERLLDGVSPIDVWTLLFDPAHADRIWFGSRLETDLRPGGSIRWTGSWEGTSFEERAIVLECEPGRFLDALYFSSFSGMEESPDTRMRLVVRLSPEGTGTRVRLEQENFLDQGKRDHSVEGWNGILDLVAEGIPAAH